MNERIKELAEQAGYLPDSFGIGHWDMPEFQKFTKLIGRGSHIARFHNERCKKYESGVNSNK